MQLNISDLTNEINEISMIDRISSGSKRLGT
jgi:hypothetical protein